MTDERPRADAPVPYAVHARIVANLQRQLDAVRQRLDLLEGRGETPTVEVPLVPPWFAVMTQKLGVREIPGSGTEPWIGWALGLVDMPADDGLAWCSAACAGAMAMAGVSLSCPVTATTPRGKVTAAARSWLQWGVPLEQPRVGAVVVLSRGPNPAHGHVALYVAQDATRLLLRGGNQANSVSDAWAPKSRLLGYRWVG